MKKPDKVPELHERLEVNGYQLLEGIVDTLLDKVKSGLASARDMACAITLLKNNGFSVDGAKTAGGKLTSLNNAIKIKLPVSMAEINGDADVE